PTPVSKSRGVLQPPRLFATAISALHYFYLQYHHQKISRVVSTRFHSAFISLVRVVAKHPDHRNKRGIFQNWILIDLLRFFEIRICV
ncbi:MAG: hypothetical protein WBP41_10570, partial [Saprospiraceae bacterium]